MQSEPHNTASEMGFGCIYIALLLKLCLYTVPSSPCDGVTCDRGYKCEVIGSVAYCEPDCVLNPCPAGHVCEVQPLFCGNVHCPGLLTCRGNLCA